MNSNRLTVLFLAAAATLLVFGSYSDSNATTTTITAQHDAFVYTYAPNYAYGNASGLYVGDVDLSGIRADPDETARTYLKFKLNSIPAGSTINSADILLRSSSLYTMQGPPTVEAHRSWNTSWSEDTITWNNAPSYNSTISDSVSVTTGETTYSWSVTADAQSGLNDDGYLTEVMIVSQEAYSGFSCLFFSKDHPDTTFAYPPRLQVTYTPPQDGGNDDCDDAYAWGYFFQRCLMGEITLNDTWALNDFDLAVVGGGCSIAASPGRDVVFYMDLLAGDVAALTYLQYEFDATMYILTDCGDLSSCVAGANASGFGEPEHLSFTAPADGIYYVVFDCVEPEGGGEMWIEYAIDCEPVATMESSWSGIKAMYDR